MNISDGRQQPGGSTPSSRAPVRINILCPVVPLPANLDLLMKRKDVQCSWVITYEVVEKYRMIEEFDLAIVCPGTIMQAEQKRLLAQTLQRAQEKNIPLLLLTEEPSLAHFAAADGNQVIPRVCLARPETPAEELWGRICAMLDFSPLFHRVEQYMGQLEKWAYSLHNRFEEIHQELHLAWRVQQDFLPKRLPRLPGVQFAALYRPASWVSGDIYDIFQLDEHHVGFYIADVVGHGVAAGLMTLFVKRALVTKEITGRSYRLLPPGQALGRLNEEICGLELPEHQFVTACYGYINTETRRLALARAGHPLPILIRPGGPPERIELEGSLLGVFPGAVFPEKDITLEPGDKMVLITDGLEQAFDVRDPLTRTLEQLAAVAAHPAEAMMEALASTLDCQQNSLHPADDITALVIEAAAPGGTAHPDLPSGMSDMKP